MRQTLTFHIVWCDCHHLVSYAMDLRRIRESRCREGILYIRKAFCCSSYCFYHNRLEIKIRRMD